LDLRTVFCILTISAFSFFSRLNSAIHSSMVSAFTVATRTVLSIQSVASPPKK
jgi:hypothetical protein